MLQNVMHATAYLIIMVAYATHPHTWQEIAIAGAYLLLFLIAFSHVLPPGDDNPNF